MACDWEQKGSVSAALYLSKVAGHVAGLLTTPVSV